MKPKNINAIGRRREVCPKCSRSIPLSMFSRHQEGCTGPVQSRYRTRDAAIGDTRCTKTRDGAECGRYKPAFAECCFRCETLDEAFLDLERRLAASAPYDPPESEMDQEATA